jgi:hypothetical protein
VNDRSVRYLGIDPTTSGEMISEPYDSVASHRESIKDRLEGRVDALREGQVDAIIDQGDEFSKVQETILTVLRFDIIPNEGEREAPVDEHDTIGDWAEELRSRLRSVKLANTDEDRLLRSAFRDDRYDSPSDWPAEEFLGELDEFIKENIDASPEYQDTLVGESAIQARIQCWGVIGR